MCLAQGHNAVTRVRLEPAAPGSRVKHSTTELLSSLESRPGSKIVGDIKFGVAGFILRLTSIGPVKLKLRLFTYHVFWVFKKTISLRRFF